MFPDHHLPYKNTGRKLRPDRRPLPRAGEIRIRVKRTLHRGEA
ncbi:MAG TPA: hypothetical protein VGK69_11195 [Gaiellaceae bacterium]